MKLPKELVDAIVNDYSNQNIQRLAGWFERFPESEEVIREVIAGGILKTALKERKWLLSAFLMNSNVSQKGLQAQHALSDEDPFCAELVKAHLNDLDKNKQSLLTHLQDRVQV